MNQQQLISPPNGDVVGTLTDPRVLSTGVGVVGMAYAEKYLWKSARGLFGTSVPSATGRPTFYAVKPDGTTDTSAPAPKLGINRQLARGAAVVGCIAGIEFSDSAPVQYGLLGAASVLLAHVIQDAFPVLNT